MPAPSDTTTISQPLVMKFAGEFAQRLGLEMYSGPTPPIAELIANAWDAQASRVNVSVPLGTPLTAGRAFKVQEVADRAKATKTFIDICLERANEPNISVNLVGAKDRANLEKVGLDGSGTKQTHSSHKWDNTMLGFRGAGFLVQPSKSEPSFVVIMCGSGGASKSELLACDLVRHIWGN